MRFLLRTFSFSMVFTFFTLSCANLVKKELKSIENNNDIDGVISTDIENKDIDSDSGGSDAGDIEGLSTVYFKFDSSELSKGAKAVLKLNSSWIIKNKELERVELEGHCDSMGSEAYNIGLGLRRAQVVKNYLISLGVSEKHLAIISYGEEKPISSDNEKNRRVNFVPIN